MGELFTHFFKNSENMIKVKYIKDFAGAKKDEIREIDGMQASTLLKRKIIKLVKEKK